MAARIYYEVLPAGDGKRWRVTRAGKGKETHATQAAAIEEAVDAASTEWRVTGEPTGLRIKGRNGRIRDERSYGNDPHPPAG